MSIAGYLIPQNPAPYRRRTPPHEKLSPPIPAAPEHYTNLDDYDPVLRSHCNLEPSKPSEPPIPSTEPAALPLDMTE
jgi:hypothetical protein